MVDTSTSLQLPTVTEDDLRDFHSEHFPSNPHPSSYLYNYTSTDAYDHGEQHDARIWAEGEKEDDYGEEDDLGYYPDGVKRTLTDEQIAMFRHTEIQMLLKERRRQREEEEEIAAVRNEEEDGEVIESGLQMDEEVNIGVDTDQHAEIDVELDDDCQAQREPGFEANIRLQADILPAEPEAVCENGPGDALASLQPRSKSQIRSQKKRSRIKNLETKINGDENIADNKDEDKGNIWNFRRRARELDEKEEQCVELDY